MLFVFNSIDDISLQINVREYRRGNQKKDNPEKLVTYTSSTQDEENQTNNITQHVVDFEIFVVFTVLLFSYICKQIKLT